MPTRFISTEEAAIRYGVTARTIRNWLKQGKINGIKEGGESGHWRIEWDERIMGRLSLAPVNAFIKKTCHMHGDSEVRNVQLENMPTGKKLTVEVAGLTEFDVIRQLRFLTGGMTIEEAQRIGTCSLCVGYRWQTETEAELRGVIHYRREREVSREQIQLGSEPYTQQEAQEVTSRYQWVMIEEEEALALVEGATVYQSFIEDHAVTQGGVMVYFDIELNRVISIDITDDYSEDIEMLETYVSRQYFDMDIEKILTVVGVVDQRLVIQEEGRSERFSLLPADIFNKLMNDEWRIYRAL